MVERRLETVELRSSFLLLGLVETFTNVGNLHVDLLETRSDSSFNSLGESTLDETSSERTESVDEERVLGVANGKLELVDLDLWNREG